jgi:hypothetical protein
MAQPLLTLFFFQPYLIELKSDHFSSIRPKDPEEN